jgi:predicted nucleic acid-binding Zn ribbon protein
MEKIGKSVERVLSRSGGGTALALAEITAAWPDAVGKAVSREAWPLRVARDGTLHVATSSSTWAFELDRLSPEIQERLRTLVGPAAPAKLRFRVGPVPAHGGPSELESGGAGEVLVVTSQIDSEATELASEIEDRELREIVARAARASLARARSGRHF